MPCCIALLALAAPRVAIVLLVVFSDWLGEAYSSALWPFLGFFFLPLTTIVYAWAIHAQGSVQGVYVVFVVLAVLMDLGLLAGPAARRRREREAWRA